MQFLLDSPGLTRDVGMDVGQIRRLIREVFPGADVRHISNGDEVEVEVDRIFALCRHTAVEGWTLCSKRRVDRTDYCPSAIEYGVLGEFTEAESAVGRLVVVMATCRLEKAIEKARSA